VLNKIYLMDCIDGMRLMKRKSVDLIIADPPFSVALGSNKSIYGSKTDSWHDMINASYFYKELFECFKEVAKDSCGVWLFSSWRTYCSMAAGIMKANLTPLSVLIWDKDWISASMRGLRQSYELVILIALGDFEIPDRTLRDIQTFKWTASKPYHPAQKPLELVKWLIEISGHPETILDPFVGSGTVPIAAKILGRQFIGFETNEEYRRIALERLSQTKLGSYSPSHKGLEKYLEE